jgi:hypothetical protein
MGLSLRYWKFNCNGVNNPILRKTLRAIILEGDYETQATLAARER